MHVELHEHAVPLLLERLLGVDEDRAAAVLVLDRAAEANVVLIMIVRRRATTQQIKNNKRISGAPI